MELPLDGCHRYDAIMDVLEKRARLFRTDRVCLHQDNAGNDLQAIGDPVLNFLQQNVFLLQQIVFFLLQLALHGDSFNTEHNGRLRAFLVEHPTSVQAHGAGAEMRKFVLDFVILHHAVFREDLLDQQAKFGNVPLSVTQCLKVLSLCLLGAHLECRIEGAARGNNA